MKKKIIPAKEFVKEAKNIIAKCKAIKQAYGEYWNQLRDSAKFSAINNNGWLHYNEITNNNGTLLDCIQMDILHDIDCYRPKSLQGIENNNGWICIESEEDLPKEVIECRTCFYNGKNYIEGVIKKRSPQELSRLKYINEITHYQPIEKTKPPIY